MEHQRSFLTRYIVSIYYSCFYIEEKISTTIGPDDTHASHFSIAQAVDTSISLLPPSSRLILTGFSHNVDHDTLNTELANNKELKAAGITAQAAYDGLRIFVAAEGLDFDDLPTVKTSSATLDSHFVVLMSKHSSGCK